ncbi:hypothetical protein BDQ17DRAFT_1428298 [Cyathus striatus]|nr:hypothetical protein BDQ17DRAFT_1428298 [Cyathus striatus]
MLMMKRYRENTSYILALGDVVSHYRDELAIKSTAENDVYATISNLCTVLIKGYEEKDIHPAAEDVITVIQGFISHFNSSLNSEQYQPLFDVPTCPPTVMPDQQHPDDTISVIIQLIGLIPSFHEERLLAFNVLYRILSFWFQKDDSKNLHVVLEDPENLFNLFYQLAETLELRSKQVVLNSPNEDLDGAILCLRATIMLPAEGSKNYVKARKILGTCLFTRYKRNDDIQDLNEGTEHLMAYEKKPDKELNDLTTRFLKLFDEELDA